METYHSRNGSTVILVQHDALSGEMTRKYFLHLFHGTVGVRPHVPVISVPPDDEPDVLGTIQLLLVRLKHRLKLFLATHVKSSYSVVILAASVYVCLFVCMSVCLSDDNFRKP